MPIEAAWRLAGSTAKVVECFVQPTASTLHQVSVVFGGEMLLTESYPDSASAMTRATQLREGLLNSGTWTVAPEAAATRSDMKSRSG
jgi:hypothetical protein